MQCPYCGEDAGFLFGGVIAPRLIASVAPNSAKQLMKELRCCVKKDCKNYGIGDVMNCPQCKAWAVTLTYGLEGGFGFMCQSQECRFVFNIAI